MPTCEYVRKAPPGRRNLEPDAAFIYVDGKRDEPLRTAALLALMLCLLAPSAVSAQSGVSLQVNAGYGGSYKPGSGPVPVRIRLSNSGPSFRASVQVDGRVTDGPVRYTTELDLPQGSEKVVTLYPSLMGLATTVSVSVLNGSRVLASGTDQLREVAEGAALYAVLSPDPTPYLTLAVQRGLESVEVVPIGTGDIPESALALSSVDVLIVDSTDTSGLTQRQRDAVRSWVAAGGHLVLAGGAGAADTAAGFGSISPVAPTGIYTTGDLSGLASLAAGPLPQGTATLSNGRPAADSRVLSARDGRPLAGVRRIGAGSVKWLAWSPSAEPFARWSGHEQLFRAASARPAAPMVTAGESGWAVSQFLQDIAGVSLPPTALIFAFLLIYSLVLGPGLYLVLKRRDRREMAWLLIPVLTVAFSALAYSANFFVRGGGATLKTLRITEAAQDAESQHSMLYIALFSTQRRSYDVELPPGYSFSGPVTQGPDPSADDSGASTRVPYQIRSADAETLVGTALDVYQLRQWTARSISPRGSAASASLQSDGAELTGQITRTADAEILDACVVYGRSSYPLGPIRASGSAQIPSASSGCWERATSDSLRGVLAGLTDPRRIGVFPPMPDEPPNSALLVTWQKETPPVQLRDASASMDGDVVTVSHLPVELRRGSLRLRVPPSGISTEDAGIMTVEYNLPQGVVPTGLGTEWSPRSQGAVPAAWAGPGGPPEPNVTAPGPAVTPQMTVLNTRSGTWDAFPTEGASSRTADYVSWDGMVRVRMAGAPDPAEVQSYVLTVEGRKE